MAQGNLPQLTQALPTIATYVERRGRYAEGVTLTTQLNQHLEQLPPTNLRDRLWITSLIWQADFAHTVGEMATAEASGQQALALLDAPTLAGEDCRSLRALVLGLLATSSPIINARTMAIAYAEESLALYRAIGDQPGEARTLTFLAYLVAIFQDKEVAQRYGQTALALYRQLGDQWGIMNALHNLSIATRDPVVRRPYLEEGLALAKHMGDKAGMARALFNLSLEVLNAGDPPSALSLAEQSVMLAHDLGSRQDIGRAHMGRGYVRLHMGQYTLAHQDAQRALEYGLAINYNWVLLNSYLLQLAAAAGLSDWQAIHPPPFTLAERQLQGMVTELINPYELRARLSQNKPDLPEIRRQLSLCLEQQLSDSLPIILANLALYLVQQNQLATAQQLYAFVQTLPDVSYSQWFADVWGQHIPGPLPEPEQGEMWTIAAAWLAQFTPQ